MHSLPIFVRLKGRKVVVIGDSEAADAKKRLIERAGGIVVGSLEVADAKLVFIALDDAGEAAEEAQYFRLLGKLVNVVDQPDLCDFTTPSIVDRDPVIIAVGTGGASAGLAKQVRLRIETLLPPGLGLLAQSIAKARMVIRSRYPDGRARRAALDAGMAPGGPLDPLGSDPAGGVAAWLATANDTAPTLREVTLHLTSSDPDDLTLKQARLLGEADVIIHAPDIPDTILNRARADAVKLMAGASVDLPQAGLVMTLELTVA
jgi:uroporphyrin-III C-methyltransferase / precorrin-2 dehydrogenase / sirohydrochlorin ferrochelatase